MQTQTESRYQSFIANCNAKRARRKLEIVNTLENAGIKFETKNNGYHLLIKSEHGLIDFFPETGRWIVRQTELRQAGTQNLINFLHKN